jgi:phasin
MPLAGLIVRRTKLVALRWQFGYVALQRIRSPHHYSPQPAPGAIRMNEHFKRQAEQFMNAAKDARIPENMQAFAIEGVAKSREAFEKINAAAQDHAKAAEDVLIATQAGAKTIGAKLIDNTARNATAVFEAAEAVARARTLPEALQVQSAFVQKQLAVAGAQTKELFDLSTRVAQQTFETMNAAAAKSFEQLKKAG